ncbi:YidC/Oxa1 family membrane protein insertase [Candidatus Peregrinibacteria bacterium]|nr:YidC/Oxa1 family membrane protein insertase [Candidatus Peregrinibacteria bacterium]
MNKNALFLMVIFISGLLLLKNAWSAGKNREQEPEGLIITPIKSEIARGKMVKFTLKNNTSAAITIPNECPEEPFDVFFSENSQWTQKHVTTEANCENIGWTQPITIEPAQKITLAYDAWNHELFNDIGKYQIKITAQTGNEKKTFTSQEITIKNESSFTLFWRNFFYRPIYNILIYFAKILPAHSLGAAIILLTILIRLILLIPSQKGMRAQKKMQAIQPKLEEVKRRHGHDQKKVAEETMAIWKEHKVNPFGSCLPILIQFPVLIALFYVVQGATNPDNAFLLYPLLREFPLNSISTNFLNILDLTKSNIFPLPILIGGLQFFQMKLAMAKKKKAEEKKPKKDDEKKTEGMDMEVMNKSMMYFMPIMIAFFTASVPAGVGLYWGVSTIFGIGQQVVVNREITKDEPTVTVIKK